MRALLLTLLLLCPMAMADNMGKMQIFATAFLDVQGLFPNTLAACAKAAPASVAPLRQQYAQWQREHGVHQQELQQLIRQILQQAQPDKADEVIASLKVAAAKELAPLHFPQNYNFRDDYFCTRLLPQEFNDTGDGLDLQFGKHVQEIKAELARRAAPAP